MIFTFFRTPYWWRLGLLLSFLFSVSKQLSAENQCFTTDSVCKIPFSTTIIQWSFDADSTGPAHGYFLQRQYESGGNDGIFPSIGFQGSDGFRVSQYSTDKGVELVLPTLDTRALIAPSFSFNLAAPSGNFENRDYIGIYISTDGGGHYYPQLKVRGSQNNTSMGGWDFEGGLHFSKDFRYSVNSSTIYGHVNPDTKDSIAGISRITITELPRVPHLAIKLEIVNSTNESEVYVVDNLTLCSENAVVAGSGFSSDSLFIFESSGSFTVPSKSVGAIIRAGDEDTVRWNGSVNLQGPLWIQSGYLDAPGLVVDRSANGQVIGGNLVSRPSIELTLRDTGYHFVGERSFFPALDTMDYSWVFDPDAGQWASPQDFYSRSDSGRSMARVVYLWPQDTPFRLQAEWRSEAEALVLGWADTVMDGETPLGGWNLVGIRADEGWNWLRLMESGALPDSIDATIYSWNAVDQSYASYNPFTGGIGMGGQMTDGTALWIRLSNKQIPTSTVKIDALDSAGIFKGAGTGAWKGVGTPDTTWFNFTTGAKSYQAMLLVDSSYQSAFMPATDQLYMGALSKDHVSIQKGGGVRLLVGCYPVSSYYPIEVSGEGHLQTNGVPGWFWIPPNLIPSHQGLKINSKGLYKVHWLSRDHPDVVYNDQGEAIGVQEHSPHPVVIEGSGLWDILGRHGNANSNIQFKYVDGRWVKIVQVP
jgi:hypothetical protein